MKDTISLDKKIKRTLCYLFKYIMPDKLYIQLLYQSRFGKRCDLYNPRTFNEKLNWLKLNDRKDFYTTLADKYAVRTYIKEKIGEGYLIPLLGTWDNVEDINIDILPEQFVLKCNHDSESVVVCKNKSEFDWNLAKRKLKKALMKNYYYEGREWVYKNIPRKIIAEKYMVDSVSEELSDYKFFCFDGVPKAMYVATDRGKKDVKFDFFDMEFNHLEIKQHYSNTDKSLKKPYNWDKMVEIASKLSQGFPHVRVDLYEADGKLYFGELTFYHLGGLIPFDDEAWDLSFGEWLTLPHEQESE